MSRDEAEKFFKIDHASDFMAEQTPLLLNCIGR